MPSSRPVLLVRSSCSAACSDLSCSGSSADGMRSTAIGICHGRRAGGTHRGVDGLGYVRWQV